MLERIADPEAAQKWIDGLDAPLPGENAAAVTASGFDDSFDQINRNE